MAYNRGQWVQSFEGQMLILRPHMTERILATVSNSAWHSRGVKGEDPIKAARAESTEMDARAKKDQGR